MNEQEFRELSAARAMHALSPDEEQAFSLALAMHPEWQSVVDEDRETAAALGGSAPEISPPDVARAAILSLISRTPQFDNARVEVSEPAPAPAAQSAGPEELQELDSDEEIRRPVKRRTWFALAASVAVLLVVSLAFPWGAVLQKKDPVTLALQQIETSSDASVVTAKLSDGATGALHWSDQARTAVLVTENMQAAPADHDYELWIVRGDEPISLGVMPVRQGGSAAYLASGFEPGDALAVTIEEQGGSPTAAPTTEPLFVLATA